MELQAEVEKSASTAADVEEEEDEDEEVVVVIRSSSVEKSNLLLLELEHARLVMRRGAATETIIRVGGWVCVRDVGDSLDVERNFCFPDRVLLWEAAVGAYDVWDG
jgi:hypothetical protein